LDDLHYTHKSYLAEYFKQAFPARITVGQSFLKNVGLNPGNSLQRIDFESPTQARICCAANYNSSATKHRAWARDIHV
jgi:hypothetical protein